MFTVRLAGGYLYGKQLFTWLSLVVSLMPSFVLSFFPLDVLVEIWDLIESVSKGLISYLLLHTGVSQTLSLMRQKYWITQGRSAVRKVLLSCTTCRRHEGGPYRMPLMPPLPAERLSESPPFAYTGVDYFGPLYIKSKKDRQKVWVCLYTSLVTRAIHLEMMHDMTTHEFLLGFRRFIARHGKPTKMISDNATLFKLAAESIHKLWGEVLTENDVVSYSSNQGIHWEIFS